MSGILQATGAIAATVGLLLEATAVAAMGSYRLRRHLPLKSPLSLMSIGFFCLCAGLAVAAASSRFD